MPPSLTAAPGSLPGDADDVLRQLVGLLKRRRMRASDLFLSIDASGDGKIEGPELKEGLRRLGLEAGDADFEVLMARLGRDGGGDVSLREFDRALKAAEKLPPRRRRAQQRRLGGALTEEDQEEVRQVFCVFRQLARERASQEAGHVEPVEWDDSGSISVEELERLLETLGVPPGTEGLDVLLRCIDGDADGETDFQEFCEAMNRKIQVDHRTADVAQAFKAFAKKAPDGFIRVRDMREALRTCMQGHLLDSDVDALLLHYQGAFSKLPGSEHEYFNYQEYLDLLAPPAGLAALAPEEAPPATPAGRSQLRLSP